jgi:hypothetical protein
LPGDPIPGFRDRLELSDLLDGAVLPFGLHIPVARVGGLNRVRLEDRAGKFGNAGGQDDRPIKIGRAMPSLRPEDQEPERGCAKGIVVAVADHESGLRIVMARRIVMVRRRIVMVRI